MSKGYEQARREWDNKTPTGKALAFLRGERAPEPESTPEAVAARREELDQLRQQGRRFAAMCARADAGGDDDRSDDELLAGLGI